MIDKSRFRLSIFIACITFVLLKSIDFGLAASIPYLPAIFPLNSQLRFRTYDYDVTAEINEFGFRGDQDELLQGQIIAVGDSFTFGLGNPDRDAWPYLLERKLHEAGDTRHVYNFGAPGTDTMFHLDTAKKSLSLKPGVVILSILLADDLQQVLEKRQRNGSQSPATAMRDAAIGTAKELLKAVFPGSYRLFRYLKFRRFDEGGLVDSEPRPISETFDKEALAELEVRVANFPPDLRQALLSGEINFGLIQFADVYPERSWKFWEDLRQPGSEALSTFEHVEVQIEQLARKMANYGGRLIVLGMPSGEFVESEFTESYRIYGASIPDSNLSTTAPEDYLREMAIRSGAEFVGSLELFRELGVDPFFPTDGHLNAYGNAQIADILHDYLYENAETNP